MKLDHLVTFLSATEDLNFTHAARRLGLSQSAVSQQIRELEDDLAVSLFERRGRGLSLTPAGERLRTRAKPIVREVRAARESIAAMRDTVQGVVHIGASQIPGVYLLPTGLESLSNAFPGIRFSIRVGESRAMVRALQDGEVDLALVEAPPPASRLVGCNLTDLLEDELVLIGAPSHPLAKSGQAVSVATLSNTPMLMWQPDTPTRNLVTDHLAQAGLHPDDIRIGYELDNAEALKRAAIAGLGVAWVSRYACTLEREAGWLVEIPVEGVRVKRQLVLIQPSSERALSHQLDVVKHLLGRAWLPQALRSQATTVAV